MYLVFFFFFVIILNCSFISFCAKNWLFKNKLNQNRVADDASGESGKEDDQEDNDEKGEGASVHFGLIVTFE